MIVIVGLGNPDKLYDKTHHNMGYMAIDHIAGMEGLSFTKEKYNAKVAEGLINGEKVLLLKPITYMNLSGDCVGMVAKKLNISSDQICILYDDIDLEVGAVRYRPSGSAGTHNGMRDIVKKLGTTDFPRIRIGIGKPTDRPLVDYVLSKIPKDNYDKYLEAFDKVHSIIIDFIKNKGKIEARSV